MTSLQSRIVQMATQVDRKLLAAEEAGYLRLDLLAHEKATWFVPSLAKLSPFATFRRFSSTAFLFFLILFSITNAQAYGKIALASVQNSWQNYEESQPVIALNSLQMDPWTGEHAADPLLKVEQAGLSSTPEEYMPALAAPASYEDRIEIPSLNINAPIVEPTLGLSAIQNKDWEALEEQIHSALTEGVVHFPGTAEPGQKGNAFLTGHSSNVIWEQSAYNTVFALLPKIKIGDEIVVTYNQTTYHYTVTDRKEVSPKDVSVLKQGEEKTLTLVTCTPVGTALRRLVVTAVLNEN